MESSMSNGAYHDQQLLSKIATNNGHGEDVEYFDGWKAYDNDPYHITKNPNGVIQMGLAENQLSFDLIKEWMVQNPQASICTNEGVDKFTDIANFQDYHGLPEFRHAVAKYMGKMRGDSVSFDPERIVMSGGATGANETLIFCLADPGDAFLVPSPYYPAFNRDLGWRTGVKLIPITCESWNDFKITKEALTSAYEDAQNKNIKIKGIIITNPSNPLGIVQDKDTLTMLVNFVNDKRIHLVCDEIYAGTVFTLPKFTSVAEVVKDMSNINLDLIHIIYSLSKDMGMPGFRVGIVYSYNDRVVTTARRMSSFGLVSSQTQHMLAAMLSDDAFVAQFLDTNKQRLSRRHQHFTSELAQVGIKCLKSNAGLFVWMDLRHLLEEATMETELKLWRVIINDVKINVSPGSSFHCSEPGWFRVCFANMDDDTVEVALQRIRTFVSHGKMEERPKHTLKKRKEQMKLGRLSFNNRRFEESLMSPHNNLVSPHSPIPQSPLVKART
ncbi:1-aminocyclopropane-1-carboxylate synthase [Beta vulgaris subsp. vulgaris]|uniref:1-aminocyclopropane-1-carboxylate synthase n=1 Tax=Beta vulgaris subsp. vulgaris TaxID=3555 RepID=UPI0020369AC2|nr:1-aminocyclopropane-1-carboxylate synthase [Beta vulgaris subsp. vulgaris]